MAISKEITTILGVKLKYHRINSITKNGKYWDIYVSSYVSEETRNLEIELQELNEKAEADTLEYSILSAKIPDTFSPEEKSRMEELDSRIDRRRMLATVQAENGGFYARIQSYQTQDLQEPVFDAAYTYLKTTEDFTCSEDV